MFATFIFVSTRDGDVPVALGVPLGLRGGPGGRPGPGPVLRGGRGGGRGPTGVAGGGRGGRGVGGRREAGGSKEC